MEDINLKTRTIILEYSLQIESDINNLLFGYLEIFEKDKIKNFGKKAGISFKSKIDLLFDIGVLSLDEHKELELLMNFRNKFLHDIDSNSFTEILRNFESGIRNRFIKFLETNIDPKKTNETDYEDTCRNLFLHNIKIISIKYKERRENIINKTNYLTSLYDSYLSLNELSTNFVKEIISISEKSNLENPLIISEFNPIIQSCLKFVEGHNLVAERIEKLGEMFELLPKKKMII